MLIDDLMGARDGDPFANLGLIPNKEINGFTLRAWLPYASKVVAKDIGNTRVIKELECKSKEGLLRQSSPIPTSLSTIPSMYPILTLW